MKKVVVAFALAACSASVSAEPVPPFSLRCNDSKQGASVRWDGKDLNIAYSSELPTSNTIMTKPVSAFTVETGRPLVGSKEPRREYRLTFHSARPKKGDSKKQEFTTIWLSLDGQDVSVAAIYRARMFGDSLFDSHGTYYSKCVTTL